MHYRLLLVDDSPEFLLTTEAILSDDFEVQAVASGEEALARKDLADFHVVCSDLSMTGITGVEVLEEARRRSPSVGLMLMTGFGELTPDLQQRVRAVEANFVRKPFDPDFFNQIARMLAETAVLRAGRIAGVR